VDRLLARLTRTRPAQPSLAAGELATAAAALPIALPLLAGAAAMRAVDRLAPALPGVRMPAAGEANLLVHLIAESVPTYLANSAVRLAVLGLPFTVSIGLRAGRTAATVRVGRGEVVV